MDFRIVWSPEASEDLESIVEYIAKDSAAYACSVVTKILNISRSIKDFPFSGRIVPEIGDENIRERFVYSYRVVYRGKTNYDCRYNSWQKIIGKYFGQIRYTIT